ncbi:MAG: DegT/DnrJ/EryC1/StrS family aminotransferase [Cyclobacteriaceae bacterium]|nr:DegT/DnrJ/EryC1/StrS family aminotransferase [Cyclobacteriaceae bacterium]
MDKIHMVDLLGQYRHIEAEVNDAIRQVIETTAFINGPAVKSFEQELSKYLGAEHVIGCANGTDALQVALMALNLPSDAEIIVPAFNYVAAAEVVALLKYKLVFCDVDERLFTLDVEDVKRKITSKTKVIIAVHLFGQAVPMEELMALAAEHNLVIIEDNAQAIGADYMFKDGSRKKLGTIGHIGTTSFFPSKNLGCYGDGGAITTNDTELASTMRSIAGHGQSKKYFYERVGVNSRLDTLQAAILRVKLKHLYAYIEKRQQAAKIYTKKLSTLSWLKTPEHASYSTHVFHQYTIQVLGKDRDEVSTQLKAAGIPSMIYYPVALHQTPAYQSMQTGNLPVSERLSTYVLSLPMHTELTSDQVQYIVDTLRAL